MTDLEKFKKFRDTKLTKLTKGAKGHYILNNAVCETIVNARPMTLKELGVIPGIKTGTEVYKKYGEAIVDYFTISSNF